MTRLALILLSLSTFAGCYNEDTFAEDLGTATCDNLTSCEADVVAAYVELGLDDATAQSTYDTTYAGACEATAESSDEEASETCDFDSAAAKDCVDAVKAMPCTFWSDGTGYPDVCGTVCG